MRAARSRCTFDREPRQVEEAAEDVVFDVRDLSVSYGDFRAVRDVTLPIYRNEITALIGPSGCGKTTFIRCLNRMNDLIESARVEGTLLYHGVDLYDPSRRPRRGAPAHRHGVPEAEPVPQVDLREHRVRPEDRRLQGRHGRARRGVAAPGGPVGRGQGQAQGVRARAVGRSAAAPVHRPGDRDPSGRDPDGRAVFGARPDRHAADRGPDAGAAVRLHDRDRHPQHAAGRPRLRPHGVLHGRGARGAGHRTGTIVEYDQTETIFTNPSDARTEDYVTGRFG